MHEKSTAPSADPGAPLHAVVAAAKATLRKELVARVRSLSPEERTARSERAAAELTALLTRTLPAGATVALYAATPTEMPSDAAVRLLAVRFRLAFPRVAGDLIRFHATNYESLTAHSNHVREPLPTDPEVIPDAIVIPARAYDRFGIRLGHGAGYYDRTLTALHSRTLLVGYCLSFQVVDELPREPFDRWVHWIVTDDNPPRRTDPFPPDSPGTVAPQAHGSEVSQ